MTRRTFNTILGATTALPSVSAAPDPDFSLAFVPDPQYLVEQCPASYNAIATWIVNNQALVVGGSSLNIKAVLNAGDCLQDPSQAVEIATAGTGWTILDAARFPSVLVPGNHDYSIPSLDKVTRSIVQPHFDTGGVFSPSVRSALPLWSTALPGGGGFGYWGGSYDTTGLNTYIRLAVGSRKLLILALEFFPRVAVLNWAKTIHDTYLDHEVMVITHSYLNDMGEQVPRGTGNFHNLYGPNLYDPGDGSMLAVPESTSGVEMWAGATNWAGFKSWRNLRIIFGGGHWIYSAAHTTGTYTPWYWQQVPIVSESANGQRVQQIFCNFQELDNATGHCGGGTPDGTGDTAHLMLFKFRPATLTLEAYALSVNSGKWIGGVGTTPASSPVLLFSVPYGNARASTFGFGGAASLR